MNILTLQLQATVGKVFNKYPPEDDGPRMHPIISYVAEEWDAAVVEKRAANLNALKMAPLAKLCRDAANEHPSWNLELYLRDLRLLNVWVVATGMWWISPGPPKPVHGDTGAQIEYM